MKQFLLPLIMVACFLSENVFFNWTPESVLDGRWILAPRFFAVALILMTIFYNRSTAIKYGFIFGLLFDVFYTEMLGVYMFVFPFIVYITSKLMKVLQSDFLIVALVVVIDLSVLESILYALNLLIQRTDLTFGQFLSDRLWATLILNLAFYLVFGGLLKNVFTHLRREILDA
ncbi:rod shape-determining protein MreD [Bacillus sp. FSL W8-0102]|uniref:rod shape-determining protein MreD n=1 Tax=Bacillus sp. FSL W8-0102 TaxID=2978205 RepID=UPI0030F95F75